MENREKEIAELAKALATLGYTVEKIEFKPASNLSTDYSCRIEVQIRLSK